MAKPDKSSTYFVKKWGEMLHIWDPIFCVNFWYQTIKDFDKAEKILKNIGIVYKFKQSSDGGFSVHEKFGQEVCIIWTKGKEVDIVHECSHATQYVMNKCGIPHNESTDEIYSYYTGFLFKSITGGMR